MAKASTKVSPVKDNPIQANDLAGAQALIDTHGELMAYLAKCDHCGIDMTPIKEQAAALADFGRRFIEAFGNNAQ